MHLEDTLATDDVWIRHHDLAVEAARTQKRWVKNVGTVGGGDQDDAFVGFEAVHLDQQLVQRLFAFVVTATETGATMATDGVDFVDEDDARCVLLRLLEHVAHAACADADEHFNEVRTGDREERHIGFTGDSTGEKRLTGTGRADQQHAAWNTAAKTLEFLRIAQEFDDFLEILFGFVDAGDILERDATMSLCQKLRLRLAEAHGAARPALHLAHEEQPDTKDQQHRQQRAEIAEEARRTIRLRTSRHDDVLRLELVEQAAVYDWRVGLEGSAILDISADDAVAGDHGIADATGINFAKELRIRDIPRTRL